MVSDLLFSLRDVEIKFGKKIIFQDLNLNLHKGDMIALVGKNGVGKTTLMKTIYGDQDLDAGELWNYPNLKVGYFNQKFEKLNNKTIEENFSDLLNEQNKHFVDIFCNKLNLDKLANVEDLSGGQKRKVYLIRSLLKDSDVLLLDEPTNHLDLETIEWLEEYLLNQKVAMVIVSHDRSFLDKICTRIINTERGKVKSYLGNYTSYLQQKDFELESKKVAYEKQQKDLRVQKAYIERFRASATRSTQAKSREKLLNKVEIIEAPESKLKGPTFQFMNAPHSGKDILRIKDLTHSYEDNILFLDACLDVEPGERIAFLGPNGSGKSTLLRLVMGLEDPDEGSIAIGKYNIIPSYFEQNQAEALDLKKTLIETISQSVPNWTQTEVRSLLGGFGLSNDSVFKEVSQISGGEKARLALALMIIKPSNFLILDEPTNHLDIPSKQMLEQALFNYNGTALIVSHDRYFLSKVANKIVEIRDGQLIKYQGDYTYYKEKKIEEKTEKEKELKLAERERKRLANREKQRKKQRLNKK